MLYIIYFFELILFLNYLNTRDIAVSQTISGMSNIQNDQ